MRKQPFFRSVGLVFLALAVFFIYGNPSGYAADVDEGMSVCNKMAAKSEFDKAVQCFNKLASSNPTNSSVYNCLGNAYAAKGDFDKAIESFNKAVSCDAAFSPPYFGLGNAYLQKGNTNKAIEYFQKVVSLSPEYPNAYSELGRVYCQKGDKDAALKQYKILNSLDKKSAEELDKNIQSKFKN